MTAPYGQPEPFNPEAIPPTARRLKPQSSRRFLPVLGAVLLAAVAFAGGFAVANATAPKTSTVADRTGQGLGPNASGRPRNGFGGGASGTIGSVSADQMTVTTAAGGSRIILLTPTTTVTQVSSATKALADLASGQTVTVLGTANPDGSTTATSVIIGNLGGLGRGFGGGGGGGAPGATSAP